MLIDSLAKDIIENESFLINYRKLHLIELNNLPKTELTKDDIFNLVQSSLYLVEKAKEDKFCDEFIIAFKIALFLLKNYSENYQNIINPLISVLIKLSNFPTIKFIFDELDMKEDFFNLWNNNKSINYNPILFKDILLKIIFNKKDEIYYTDFQLEVLNNLSLGKDIAFSAPTSAGKSFILKDFIYEIFDKSDEINVIYLVPTVALINEIHKELKLELEKRNINNFSVINSSAVFDIKECENIFDKKNIFIFTPERLQNLLEKKIDLEINLLIIDEAHKISSSNRGILLINVIKGVIKENKRIQKVFLAPFVKNVNKFKEIFEIENIIIQKTEKALTIQNKIFIEIENNEFKYYIYLEEIKEKIYFSRKKTNKIIDEDLFINLIKLNSKNDSEPNIIFCNSPNACRERSELFYQKIDDFTNENDDLIKKIADFFHKEYYLCKLLKKGICVHCGTIPQNIRLLIEKKFSEKKIKYLFATSTLLEGVNMPVKNIYLFNPKNGFNSFESIDYKNLIGRAGRLLKHFYGNIYHIQYQNWNTDFNLDLNSEIEPEIKTEIEKNLRTKENINHLRNFLKNKFKTIDTYNSIINSLLIQDFLNNKKLQDEIKTQTNLTDRVMNNFLKDFEIFKSNFLVPLDLLKKHIGVSPLFMKILYQNLLNIKAKNKEFPFLFDFSNLKYTPELSKKIKVLLHFILDDNLRVRVQGKYYKVSKDRLQIRLERWIREESLNEMIQSFINWGNKKNNDNENKLLTELTDRAIYEINTEVNFVVEDCLAYTEKLIKYDISKRMKFFLDSLIKIFDYDENDKKILGFKKLISSIENGASDSLTIQLLILGFDRTTAIRISKHLYKNLNLKNNPFETNIGSLKLYLTKNKMSLINIYGKDEVERIL